jgi:YVTN family beta-propeller protein
MIDGETNDTTTVAASSGPYAMAVNPVTNKIYVASFWGNSVTVIDGATNDTITVPAGVTPYAVGVNPASNKIYVVNRNSDNVTIINGATNDTVTVSVGASPEAVAVDPITNKIYVTNRDTNTVPVIDGATNEPATVPVNANPRAVAVNPVTNKIYVASDSSDRVTVIDGATNDTASVAVDADPCAMAVNPVTNKIYVANAKGNSVTVIDGATSATITVAAGSEPQAVAVNPVTGRVYVANGTSNNVTVITEVPACQTLVCATFDRLPGDTTSFGRPWLTGKGVNRSSPDRTAMMGVLNRVGTTQMRWGWATVTSGAGTDSITWSYTWGADSLISGENFICCVPLEDQAATTGNLGLGSPFAGDLQVYPVYRMVHNVGQEEAAGNGVRTASLPTIVRGVLFLPASGVERPASSVLLDIAGRKVFDLVPGANDVSALAPGVYFVREPSGVRKVVLAK